MNCKQAREIMNLVFDGEAQPLEANAREHVGECRECRQWLAGVERVVECVVSARAQIPQVDIAALVMSRLPARHPASVQRPRALVSRRAVSWMLIGWAAAFCIMVVLGALAFRWLGTPSAGERVVQSYSAVRGIAETSAAVLGVFKPLVTAVGSVAVGYRSDAVNLFVALVLLESMVVITGCAVWRRRSKISGSMSVLV